jgi:beta-1,4-mannosyl-glycoprotein beta-1,4-N-acetylglucosaminyltransferase
MKVVDCFTFFNELDLLELRLRLLSDVVDKFVICESNMTHSGKVKPYYYEENIDRFKKWQDKILYLPIEQSTAGLNFDNVSRYTPNNGSWILENQQRMAIQYAEEIIDDEDLVLIGDLDEIPDPRAITALVQNDIIVNGVNNAISFSMLFHYYYMNCQMEGYDRYWNGTVACLGDYYKKEGPQKLRDNRNHYTRIPNSGWHFSYLGGPSKVRTKIESFAHTEFNRPEIISEENLTDAIENGKDIFKRSGISYTVVPVSQYPEPIRSLMIEYPQFIKDETTINS